MYLGQWGVFLGPIKQTVLTEVYALRNAAELEKFTVQGKKHFIRRDGFSCRSNRTQAHVQLQ